MAPIYLAADSKFEIPVWHFGTSVLQQYDQQYCIPKQHHSNRFIFQVLRFSARCMFVPHFGSRTDGELGFFDPLQCTPLPKTKPEQPVPQVMYRLICFVDLSDR